MEQLIPFVRYLRATKRHVTLSSIFFPCGKPTLCHHSRCLSVARGNIFGQQLHCIYRADSFQIRPKYRGLGYACLKGAIF